jgi:sugar lactone lactonase YvrE
MKRFFATAMFVCVAAGNSATTYVIETVAGSNLAGDGGQAASASFASMEGVGVDSAGNVYVADAGDNRVRKIAPSGVVSTLAGDGFAGARGDGGPAVSAQLHAPYGVAVDLAGNVYIADLGNNRVRRVDGAGKISTVGGDAQHLFAPRNVAVDAAGNLYIAEFEAHRITRISRDGTATVIAGTGEA